MVGTTSTILIKVEFLKTKSPKALGRLLTITGMTHKSNTVFYQSTENGSINRGVYSVNANR